MSDKDRLIELLEQHCLLRTDYLECTASEETKCSACLADHLISNGVIVPPCKVGERVWVIRNYKSKKCTQEGIVSEMFFTRSMKLMIVVRHIARGEFGKTVFLTREEAEQALKEREQG